MVGRDSRRSLFTVLLITLVCGSLHADARAEIVTSTDEHFVLRHEAHSTRSVEALWQRLIDPASWWHPEHTYSGDAQNLSLDVRAGGLWQETWEGGSVAHGRVLIALPQRTLRLDAPFGPLQELGAYTVWTVTLAAEEGGTKVVFDEVSTAPPGSNMTAMAEAVDFVKSEAIKRLVGP